MIIKNNATITVMLLPIGGRAIKGVARKKLGGAKFSNYYNERHLLTTTYLRNISENVNFLQFLCSHKLAAKLCQKFYAFFEKVN